MDDDGMTHISRSFGDNPSGNSITTRHYSDDSEWTPCSDGNYIVTGGGRIDNLAYMAVKKLYK